MEKTKVHMVGVSMLKAVPQKLGDKDGYKVQFLDDYETWMPESDIHNTYVEISGETLPNDITSPAEMHKFIQEIKFDVNVIENGDALPTCVVVCKITLTNGYAVTKTEFSTNMCDGNNILEIMKEKAQSNALKECAKNLDFMKHWARYGALTIIES